jgi:hypothetical protein
VDIIRTILIALAGRLDLTSSDLAFREPNNSDSAMAGMEADLAETGWYTNEGYAELLPEIYMGCELVGLKVSSAYGLVTCRFSDGQEVECDLLIGRYS